MKARKVFWFRMEPTAGQRAALERNAGSRRWVWNWALGRKQEYYRDNQVALQTSVLKAELPLLKRKPETAWLADAAAQSLQEALRDLDRAFKNFFERRAGAPRFKSRKRDTSRFRVSQDVTIGNGKVYVPKIGAIRIRQSRKVEGDTKSGTFKQDASGNWDVTLVTAFKMPDTALPPANPSHVVGIDLGLKDFAVLSNGEREAIPQFSRKAERKMRRAQRVLARREKGSARRLRAKRKVALVHRKVANQRKDFLHKVTTRLVRDYEGVCIEDLNVKGLAKTKLARSVLDAGFGEFRRQLEYKTIWNRRHLAVVGRFFPSSKACHDCGAINSALALADRSWTCVCGAVHDRDLNAALNIRTEGLSILAAGHAESKRTGTRCKTLAVGAAGVEL